MSTDEFTNGQYSFHGYASSKIYYENEDKLWHLELLSNSSIYATTKASNGDYPFGTRRWQVFSGQVQGNFTFNFNGCDDHIHYNCNDGSCITADRRYTILQLFWNKQCISVIKV